MSAIVPFLLVLSAALEIECQLCYMCNISLIIRYILLFFLFHYAHFYVHHSLSFLTVSGIICYF